MQPSAGGDEMTEDPGPDVEAIRAEPDIRAMERGVAAMKFGGKSLNNEQQNDTAEALARWFESQEISSHESVPIMCKLISVILRTSAPKNPQARKEGAKIVAGIITAGVGDDIIEHEGE
jgi:hypothetical protein